jgi:hypothetical protein
MNYNSTKIYHTKNKITQYTWITFTEFYNLGDLKNIFIENNDGFGWKDTFSYNPNGEVLFISQDHKSYKGIWFVLNNIRITILEKECVQV